MLYMATGNPAHLSPETCRIKPLRRIKTQLLHLVGLISLLQSMMLGTTNIKLPKKSHTDPEGCILHRQQLVHTSRTSSVLNCIFILCARFTASIFSRHDSLFLMPHVLSILACPFKHCSVQFHYITINTCRNQATER